jgi:hypothetical protein
LKTSRKAAYHTYPPFGLAQQQSSAIGTDLSPSKIGLYFTGKMRCKTEADLITLCHQKPLFLSGVK